MTITEASGTTPQPAKLANPLYYLHNMETVVNWVERHHSDLLTGDERRRLAQFGGLSVSARALLTRLVMRTGELFRSDKLRYPELPESQAEALAELAEDRWIVTVDSVTLEDLFRLFTLAELRPAFADTLNTLDLPRTLPKARLKSVLLDHLGDRVALADWLPSHREAVIGLDDMPLFDRIRLMFFGNLRQSWSDFVLVELGYQRYETVPFTPQSRAFQRRSEVDSYLLMHRCREQLDAGEPAAVVWPQVPPATDNAWLASRHDRLLLELGRQAERQGDRELALQVLARSQHREARLKQLRLLERMQRFDQAWAIASHWQTTDLSDAEAQGLARILKRLAAKVGQAVPALPTEPVPETFQLTLPQTGVSVEVAVQQHLWRDRQPVFYVENVLINGLFGLLCWEVIFEPVPGAFFHPFHAGPADLTREDFVPRRRALLEGCLGRLQADYRDAMRATFHRKQGLANPFVNWSLLTEELLTLALDCIPAAHLDALFRRLLGNLKEHRSGFPDLIRFRPDAPAPADRYEMIEVKGPGDRLQDHQRRWLAFFHRQGIRATVCHVRWQEDA